MKPIEPIKLTKNFSEISERKNKRCANTTKILFVLGIVQRVIGYIHLGLALVAVGVQVITSANDQGNH